MLQKSSLVGRILDEAGKKEEKLYYSIQAIFDVVLREEDGNDPSTVSETKKNTRRKEACQALLATLEHPGIVVRSVDDFKAVAFYLGWEANNDESLENFRKNYLRLCQLCNLKGALFDVINITAPNSEQGLFFQDLFQDFFYTSGPKCGIKYNCFKSVLPHIIKDTTFFVQLFLSLKNEQVQNAFRVAEFRNDVEKLVASPDGLFSLLQALPPVRRALVWNALGLCNKFKDKGIFNNIDEAQKNNLLDFTQKPMSNPDLLKLSILLEAQRMSVNAGGKKIAIINALKDENDVHSALNNKNSSLYKALNSKRYGFMTFGGSGPSFFSTKSRTLQRAQKISKELQPTYSSKY